METDGSRMSSLSVVERLRYQLDAPDVDGCVFVARGDVAAVLRLVDAADKPVGFLVGEPLTQEQVDWWLAVRREFGLLKLKP